MNIKREVLFKIMGSGNGICFLEDVVELRMMPEGFEIPVTYKNQEQIFKAHVLRYGYVQHILVDLYGTQITIERDEESRYRALGDRDKMKDAKIDLGLVQAVVEVLEAL